MSARRGQAKRGRGSSLSRRRFLAGVVALAATLPLLGASPEALPRRKARFKYNSSSVKVGFSAGELLRESDKQAMKSLESGWPTRLVYDIALFEKGGARKPVATVQVEIRVQWDPWNRDYMVQTTIDGGRPTLRRYVLQADAIKAATQLLVPVAKTPTLARGEDNVYFVSVFAQRNPIESKSGGAGAGARGQDRDLEVFSRWVGMFVRSRPKAEKTTEFRTAPFYVPQD